MEKVIAVVEKFAGKIKAKTNPTGNHKYSKLSLKIICFSLFLARYLETYIIKTTDANVDV